MQFVKPTLKQLQLDNDTFKKMSFNGVIPSDEDKRDYTPDMVAAAAVPIPEEYEAPSIAILNQGNVGSCVAHSCAEAMMLQEETTLLSHRNYSRGYIYANRRPTDYQGSGMQMRQALKQLNKCGDVLYEDFPFNMEYPAIKTLMTNPEGLAAKALEYAIYDYYRCYEVDDIKRAIMSRGGVLVCVPVYDSFARDLHKPYPEDKLEGYHAMVIVGWTADGRWIVQNSWGKTWGYKGKLLMDPDYPVREYWAITLNPSLEPKKKTWWERFIDWLRAFFVM